MTDNPYEKLAADVEQLMADTIDQLLDDCFGMVLNNFPPLRARYDGETLENQRTARLNFKAKSLTSATERLKSQYNRTLN